MWEIIKWIFIIIIVGNILFFLIQFIVMLFYSFKDDD